MVVNILGLDDLNGRFLKVLSIAPSLFSRRLRGNLFASQTDLEESEAGFSAVFAAANPKVVRDVGRGSRIESITRAGRLSLC